MTETFFWQNPRLQLNPLSKKVPLGADVPENRQRSQAEVAAFIEEKPERYFLYINENTREATTWMGDKLGTVTFGRPYHMGDLRHPVTIRGINGVTYVGTYYKGAGDYARVRRKRGR